MSLYKFPFQILNEKKPEGKLEVCDTDFKKHYSNIDGNITWDSLCSSMHDALEEFVIPYIGEAFYNDLVCRFLEDPKSLNKLQQKIMHKLQGVVAWYTMLCEFPQRNVRVTGMGLQQNNDKENTSQPVNQWRYKNAFWQICEKADKRMDRLMEFLENSTDSYVNQWRNSDAYWCQATCFFRTTQQFEKYFKFGKSRRAFLSLKPFICAAEEEVRRCLCDDTFEILKNLGIEKTAISVSPTFQQIFQAHSGSKLQLPAGTLQGINLEGLSDSEITGKFYISAAGVQFFHGESEEEINYFTIDIENDEICFNSDLKSQDIFISIICERVAEESEATEVKDEQVKLLELVQKYVANKAMADSAWKCSIIRDPDGWKVASSNDAFNFKQNALGKNWHNAIAQFEEEATTTATITMEEIKCFLKANVECFPEWQKDTGYEPDPPCAEDQSGCVICTGPGAIAF